MPHAIVHTRRRIIHLQRMAISNELVLVHTGLMMTGWMVVAPLGVVAARHRWTFGNAQCLGVHKWYHVHRMLMFLSLSLSTVGFVIPLTTPEYRAPHRYLGIGVMCLVYFQVFITLIRPPTYDHRRNWWNYAHMWIARTILLAAVVECGIGFIPFPSLGLSILPWVVPFGAFWTSIIIVECVLTCRSPQMKTLIASASQTQQQNPSLQVVLS